MDQAVDKNIGRGPQDDAAHTQVIDAAMAVTLQAEAAQVNTLFAWVVSRYQRGYPGKFVARLVTTAPTNSVLVGDTLGELQAQLPSGLQHSECLPVDPRDVIEVWFLR